MKPNEKNYYVHMSNATDDFITIGDPVEFYHNYNKARSYAIEKSKEYVAVDLRCEQFIDDGFWDALIEIWAERYENGKKKWRMELI